MHKQVNGIEDRYNSQPAQPVRKTQTVKGSNKAASSRRMRKNAKGSSTSKVMVSFQQTAKEIIMKNILLIY